MKRNCIKLRCLSLTRSLVQLFRACRLSFFYYSSSPRYRAVVTAGGRIKIRLHSGWRRKEKRKKLSENYPPRVTLARCRLEIYATRRLILSIESFGRFENRPVKSRSLRASFLPTATREGDFSRVSRRVESLRRQNDPMSSARQTADAFARFKSPDRSISSAMHYSPECFISPFLNRLSAPTWRDAKLSHLLSFFSQPGANNVSRYSPLRTERTTSLELFRGYSSRRESLKFNEAPLVRRGRCPRRTTSPLLLPLS